MSAGQCVCQGYLSSFASSKTPNPNSEVILQEITPHPPPHKNKRNSPDKRDFCFTGALKHGQWRQSDGEVVRVQPETNTMKSTEMKRVKLRGEKSKNTFWLEWRHQPHSDKVKRGDGSTDGDVGPETAEADTWSCSSTDSLRVKLEPPTAGCFLL